MTTSPSRIVHPLLHAQALYVPYGANYVNGPYFSGPHVHVVCTEDAVVDEFMALDDPRAPNREELIARRFMAYRKPGRLSYWAVRQDDSFEVEVTASAKFTVIERNSRHNCEYTSDELVSLRFESDDGLLGFIVNRSDNPHEMNYLGDREVSYFQIARVWANLPSGESTIEFLIDGDEERVVRLTHIEFSAIANRTRYRTENREVRLVDSMLAVKFAGEPGNWLVTNTETNEHHIGFGDVLPAGYWAPPNKE